VYVYIQNMKDQISTDPLTKLNNRSQLIKYVSQEGSHHMEGTQTYVLMIDVNSFKKINDRYGHAEGDHALVMIAQALMRAGQKMKQHPFIGRYGGDEFIMIFHSSEESEPELLSGYIREELENICAENHIKYNLSVGIGCAEWHKEEDFQSCMVRADKRLYKDKKKIKRSSAMQSEPKAG